ncbi:helix-turn-helix transcriptional regulator [Cellulomonas humilata]|uniref:Helix-turn-helix transcriptional regulator n=1 Tax=Cellulomonas humilata TaxID=144055 RepID=A0A7Y6A2X4_9CELL|nr:helix-turn-helix transcriptional regulator [Cellulomonas humilata]
MIDILILGVLRNGPVHGYELKRRVQRPTLRPLSNNSLYPLLRRFEERGAVTKQVETTEGRPARNTYAITAAGHALFHELITTLSADEAGQDEEFLLRVGFFDEMTPAERLAVLGARDAALEEQLARATQLLASVQDPAGWRARSMGHLLDRLARDRAFVADLAEVSGRDSDAR